MILRYLVKVVKLLRFVFWGFFALSVFDACCCVVDCVSADVSANLGLRCTCMVV